MVDEMCELKQSSKRSNVLRRFGSR